MHFKLLLNIAKYWSELFSGRILALSLEYFLYLMYFKDSPSIYFLKIFTILHVFKKMNPSQSVTKFRGFFSQHMQNGHNLKKTNWMRIFEVHKV